MMHWELAAVGTVVFLLIAGLTRLTLKRRTEILKEYFLPEEMTLEQTILRPEKVAAKTSEEDSQESASD